VHVTPYVAPALVSAFVEGATAGVVPSLHVPNHEISLPTKYYEYALAGLPVVVSDIAVVARTTRELGNGEVFRAGDAAACTAAARLVIEAPGPYRAPYTAELRDSFTWQRQVPGLLAVYERLTGRAPQSPAASGAFSASPLELAPPVPSVAVR
jgi:glycosyltransferase involved in cell wall biosynthesis